MQERWEERPEATPIALRRPASPSDLTTGDPSPQPDRAAAIAVRDRADQLVRPAGSLGALDAALERWASITGAAPSPSLRAGVLVAAADHGHTTRGTSLFPSEVSSQVAAAAARGETAVSVLARQGGHALRVVDIGLDAPTPPGALDRKIRRATGDVLEGPAMTAEEHAEAVRIGAALVDELIERDEIDLLIPGEIGIGNTTTAAILGAAFLGVPEHLVVGRGAGADAAGLDRKRAVVDAALRRHEEAVDQRDSDAIIAALGGLEFSLLSGAIKQAARRRIPVLLDGFATGVAALASVRRDPWVAEFLLAGHRSAEPGHGAVLTELGLEPLLDLRLRLGEASGALLALPLLQSVGALHHGMATFAEAGVSGASSSRIGAAGTTPPAASTSIDG